MDNVSLPPQLPARAARSGLPARESQALLGGSLLVLGLSYLALWPIAVTEAWGFVTGGVCVWLVVREHIWNWPIGLANNAFFFVLFLEGRLFADMGLQVAYFALGVYGWIHWLAGGQGRTRLSVGRATRSEWVVLAFAIPACTLGLRAWLVHVGDAAPFLDALTTVVSLAAQYLLTRKRIENWFFWIAADLVYVPLYLARSLPLTALLYAVFLAMCVYGLREWSRSLRTEPRA